MRTILLIFAGILAMGCGDDSSGTASNSGGGGGTSGDAGGDASNGITLRIEPLTEAATVVKGQTPPTLTFQAFATPPGGTESEVTAQASFSLANTKLGTFGANGVLTLAEAGGATKVVATHQGATAAADLVVKLTGDVFLPGTDATSKSAYDSATPDPNPANAPTIEYPEEGTVVPGNLPPIELQWSVAGDSTFYRLGVKSGDVLDLAFYTPNRELEIPTADWAQIASAAPDQDLLLTTEGVGPSGKKTSAVRKMVITADEIDESSIYVWVSSKGAFAVLDIINQLETPLPNDSPQLATGQPCSGCHRVSRDGKRFSYSYNGADFQIGTLAYDSAAKSFNAKIAPAPGVRGTYAAFNPSESTQRPAMLLSVPDDVEQNTAGNVTLQMVDPDTNQPIPSDMATAIAGIPAATGHHALMPDWSPAGDFVTFVAYPGDQHFVREVGDDVTLGSIVEANVAYDPGTQEFHFANAKVVVQTPSTDPVAGENNILPAISPDAKAIAFTRADGYWSIQTQQTLLNLSGRIAVVRRSDGTVLPLAGGSNGPNHDWSSTWPQWAPVEGSRYLWLAYASERPYGHRLTQSSPENASCGFVQGQKQCKHIWVMAIDRAQLESGNVDPSRAPFWVPGQVLAQQYVSPFWTKSVLPGPK
jgi:hypothetical protein